MNCSSSTRWECVNEVTPDDTDYLESDLISTSASDESFLGLSNISDPLKSDGHVLSFRARDAGVGTNTNSLTVELRQSTVVIATTIIPQNTLASSFQTYSYTLTDSEANSITNYNLLEVKLLTECSGCAGQSARDRTQVSWIEFKVIDNPPLIPPTLDSVTFESDTELRLNFTEPANTAGILSYDLERDQGSGFTNVGSIPFGETTWVDNGLAPNTFYNYRLISVGSGGVTSIPSNVVGQTTTAIIIEAIYARPDSDTGQDWGNSINCNPSTRWECVNEVLEDYGFDYLESDLIGVSNDDQAFMGLSDLQVPQGSLDHVIRFIAREAGLGSNHPSLSVELRQGTTVIATADIQQGTLADEWQLYEYKLTNSEKNSISDYSDLEVRLFTECSSGCSGQEARDRTQVSWIEFKVLLVPKPPVMTDIDTLNSTSIKITWTNENLHEHIKKIIIQRSDGGPFITIGNVTNSTTSFITTGLSPEVIYSFRLIGQGSFTNPSDILQGATPASINSVNGNGTIIEPNPTNSLTKLQKEIFTQTIEHFNVTSTIIDQIISDFNVGQLNMYEVIVKMLDSSYGSSQEILNTGAYYGTRYVENGDIDQFLQTITDEVKISLGNTSPDGNNPDHATESVGQ